MQKRILMGFSLLCLLIFAAVFIALQESSKLPDRSSDSAKIFSKEKARGKLDFLLKNPEELDSRIYAVMVDNHPAGRTHHTGLSQASVFYEAPAEGGITRILALFEGSVLNRAGPIRSIRPYFIDFAAQYSPVLIHIGGSPEASNQVRKEKTILDVDGMRYEGVEDYIYRDRTISMPHNEFANLKSISKIADEKKFISNEGPFFEFDFNAPDFGKESKNITLDFSFPQYKVRYEYDEKLQAYKRFIGGNPHKDAASGSQLIAQNIIVQFTNYYPIDSEGRLRMKTQDAGKTLFFRDGKVFEGSWENKDGLRTLYFDEKGNVWKLRPGTVWIEVINDERRVKFD